MDNDEREDNLEGNPADAGTDDLDALRHYGTHTLPPGMRMQWLAKPLPRLTEEHLQATDELEPKALEPPAPIAAEATNSPAARRPLLTRRLVVGAVALGLAVGGVVSFVVRPLAKRGDSGTQIASSETSVSSARPPIGTDGKDTGYAPRALAPETSASPGSKAMLSTVPSSSSQSPAANGASDRIRKHTSVDNESGTFCTLNSTSCEALNDFLSPCSSDTQCGFGIGVDAKCSESLIGSGEFYCTMKCAADVDCYTKFSCLGGAVKYCSLTTN